MEEATEVNTDIDKEEVYRYLGVKGGRIDSKTAAEIKEAVAELQNEVRIKKIQKEFVVEKTKSGIMLVNTNIMLTGKSVNTLLEDSKRCVLFAITLGEGAERLLRKMQLVNMSKAVIMDACASSMIEQACNGYEEQIKDAYADQKVYFTDRFSPGYGDLKLSVQKEVCKVLETEKTIGVIATKDGIMIPRKSITSILGIAKRPQKMRIKGCKYCDMKENCDYRKRGSNCE